MAAAAELIPLVSIEEFEALTCNRCGDCCQEFWLPSPLELARTIGNALEWDEYNSATGAPVDPDNALFAEWLGHVEPHANQSPPRWGERQKFRCDRFVIDEEGIGQCTAYERRPHTCSDFPYGRPQAISPRCSWNVEVFVI